MATVNFECGHCHNLMAVGEEFLGQQVRCPHCQQVVLAPVLSPEGPSVEVPAPPEHESIFGPSEAAGEDVFGVAPAPRVELPTEAALPRLDLDRQAQPAAAEVTPLPPPAGEDEPTLTYPGAGPAPSVAGAEGPAAPAEEEGSLPLRVEPRRRPSRGGGWVIAIVIVPLISYSILATVAIILLLTEREKQTHPLEMVPDLEGDNKGGASRGTGKRGSVDVPMPDPEQPVPAKLRVPLGQTLTVGDLEVTPEKVEVASHAWAIGKTEPQKFPRDVLCLTLKLRNRSGDVTFKPMDRYFDRHWNRNNVNDPKPYTLLEMGPRRFYGGPLDWSRKNEFIEGQKVNTELKPGEEMQTFVCTDPYESEDAAKELAGYQGPLLWRVQLRRGLVRWTTKGGAERDDPATAVVGVEFDAGDVHKAVN
jgi:hypothetical protein